MSREASERPRGRPRGGGPRKGGPRRKRRRVCNFCADRRTFIVDYKHVRTLRDYLDERGRIRKARQTGACRKHQRKLGRAIKLARQMALVPYTTD
ncbi:MAG: 30S ribosomal protein S18 [Armatimonadetes bacterium]|nr:30S ribosomal protein S18 [Armatimonadota bacterium]